MRLVLFISIITVNVADTAVLIYRLLTTGYWLLFYRDDLRCSPVVLAGVVVEQLGFVIVRDLPPAKFCAQLIRLEQERRVSRLRFRAFVDQVNPGDERAAPANSCAKARPEVALQVVENADQIVALSVDDKMPALKVCDSCVNCDAAHPRPAFCDLDTDARSVHGCDVPAALRQENRVTTCAARHVESAPRL